MEELNICVWFMIFIIGPHCSCPNGLVTSNMAPAHPHATSARVYGLVYKRPVYKRHEPEICQNFKNKIWECPGWDSVLAIFKKKLLKFFTKKNRFFKNLGSLSLKITSFFSLPLKSGIIFKNPWCWSSLRYNCSK